MVNAIRQHSLSVTDVLLQNPRSFCFEMAVKTICYNSKISFGSERVIAQQPMKIENINVLYLRGTEIGGISNDNGKLTLQVERLTLAGLNAPLPTPYTELLIERKREKDLSMSQFLNIFNTRLLGISYRISEKRYTCLRPKDYAMKKILPAFFGEDHHDFNLRLSRLSYLFWIKEKSIAGLESILRYLLELDVKIIPAVLMKLENKHIKRLGQMKLGIDSDIGKHFYVSHFKIKIHLSKCDHKYVTDFINNVHYVSKLNKLVSKYFSHTCHYAMFIRPNEAPHLKFQNFVLGRTSWLAGKHVDEVKISHLSA